MNMTPSRWSFRTQFLLGFAICVALLGFAFYLQLREVNPLEPCPLCIFQRVAFAGLGLVLLIGGLHAPRSAAVRRGYGVLAALAAGAGAAIATRHVWLQSLPPDKVPDCGPALEWMIETAPLYDVVRKVLTGSGECAKVDWSWLGLSIPAWSLVWFVGLAMWALYAAFHRR